MLTSIQALHCRSLRYVDAPLEAFHILVGPNAEGVQQLNLKAC